MAEKIIPPEKEHENFIENIKADRAELDNLVDSIKKAGHLVKELGRKDKKFLHAVLNGKRLFDFDEREQLKNLYILLEDIREDLMIADKSVEHLCTHLMKEISFLGDDVELHHKSQKS